MSTTDNKALARRFYDEVLNARNTDVLADIASADYVEHDPLPGQGEGIDGLRERVSMLSDGLGAVFSVEDVIAEDDRVVVRWTNSGTHSGTFLGIPPTGRQFSIAGIDIYRCQNGRLAEHWHVVDQLTMLQQLGLLPAPEGSPA